MKIYISGKIGEEVISPQTREKFRAAERMLREKGHSVFNPASAWWQRALKEDLDFRMETFRRCGFDFNRYAEMLHKDMAKLVACDAIYMLGDWSDSSGANVELNFAMAIGLKIYWQKEEDARLNYDTNDSGQQWEDVWLPIDAEADKREPDDE